MKNIYQSIHKLYENWTVSLSFMVALIMLSLDYMTGRNIQFPIFYVLPVGMLAYRNHKITSYVVATLLPLARVGFYFMWSENEFIHVIISNAFINIFALFLYIYLVSKIIFQTSLLERRVKILEGILPSCPICKRIRNEEGRYEQAEKYITEHSEAEFSHGLCPDCTNEFYPKYFKDKIKFIAKQTTAKE